MEFINLLDKDIYLVLDAYHIHMYYLFMSYRTRGVVGSMKIRVPTHMEFDKRHKATKVIKMSSLTKLILNIYIKNDDCIYLPNKSKGNIAVFPSKYMKNDLDLQYYSGMNKIKGSMAHRIYNGYGARMKNETMDDGSNIDVIHLDKENCVKIMPEHSYLANRKYIVDKNTYINFAPYRDDLAIISSHADEDIIDDRKMTDEETKEYLQVRRGIDRHLKIMEDKKAIKREYKSEYEFLLEKDKLYQKYVEIFNRLPKITNYILVSAHDSDDDKYSYMLALPFIYT